MKERTMYTQLLPVSVGNAAGAVTRTQRMTFRIQSQSSR